MTHHFHTMALKPCPYECSLSFVSHMESPVRVFDMDEDRALKQEAFWDSKYSEAPNFFGFLESAFSHWALSFLNHQSAKDVLELGAGYGRDSTYLSDIGMRVTAVEISSVGYNEARKLCSRRKYIELHRENAIRFLTSCKEERFDAVYSNLFLNMHFTIDEHTAIFGEIVRVLKPGGLHLFSVRSRSDPWYGRGLRVAADTFDHTPSGTTMVYFSEERIREITPEQLSTLRIEEVEEGKTDFPITVLYVAQSKAK